MKNNQRFLRFFFAWLIFSVIGWTVSAGILGYSIINPVSIAATETAATARFNEMMQRNIPGRTRG